ncbi:MAG: carbohydrate ABC transporter permease [Butyrivibrio sp.]|nr:carbohydrate ABC transporter permease [Acetatifactor muris]MCM1559971.1 carbohydrate ABC transporter permease [Butyrivibrio sp.]
MSKRVKDVEESTAGDGSRAINKFRLSDAVMMFVIVLVCLTCILPFIHVTAKSLSSNSYVSAQKVTLWPKGFTTEAYRQVFSDSSMIYSMIFSVIVTVLFTLLGLVVCLFAAYPLSKKELPFKRTITFLLVFPMYFGAGLIPTYLLFNNLKLIDNFWVLILPGIYSAYNMLVMKTYFHSSIPDSLEESAFLDGASYFQIIRYIILPLSKPIIATLGLFYAVGRWNSYGDNLYYLRMRTDLRMLQYKLYLLVSTAQEALSTAAQEGSAVPTTPEVLQAATIMFATVPIIIVYPFLQKYFVKGAMIGSVKG